MKNQFHRIAAAVALFACIAARAEIVVIVNPAAGPLTQDQVTDIYLGRSNLMTPIDQVDANPIKAEFYKKTTGRDLSQVKAAWSRIVFTGKGMAPHEAADAAAVKKAVASDVKAVGYIDRSALDGTVKVALTIN